MQQFTSYGTLLTCFLCQRNHNTNSQTWPQCFKPKLDNQLLWPVSINYPDFTTVCSEPLFRARRVITGKTCLKLLLSRWQAGNTQELVSPTMCSHWSLYSEHLAFRWHGAATGLAELKWVMVIVLLADEESSRFPGPRKQMLCRRRKNLAARPVQARRTVWLQMGQFPAAKLGGNVGFRSWILIGRGALLKFKAYSCERVKEWKVNRLDSVVCGAAFDESRQLSAAHWQGALPRQRSSHHSRMRYYSAVYLLKSALRVWPLFIALMFVWKIHKVLLSCKTVSRSRYIYVCEGS